VKNKVNGISIVFDKIPAIKEIKIILGAKISKKIKMNEKAITPKTKDTIIANKKEARILPLTIFVFVLFGLTTPRNNPDVNRADNEPEIFPLISKKPGRRISIPGIRSNLFVYTARIVPAISPPTIETI